MHEIGGYVSRRFDDALAACNRLIEEFPTSSMAFERSGMVHAKMGQDG